MPILKISDEYYFSPPEDKDVPRYVTCLADREISDQTLMIPFPYTEADGRWYVNSCREKTGKYGHALSFAIRRSSGELIGGASFHGKNFPEALAHRDEVGYWIAKPYWGKGIMTKALPVLLEYGRTVRGLSRFEAPIFAFNIASERVLLKCGFKEEGLLKNAYFKNGRFFDGKLFALVDG